MKAVYCVYFHLIRGMVPTIPSALLSEFLRYISENISFLNTRPSGNLAFDFTVSLNKSIYRTLLV